MREKLLIALLSVCCTLLVVNLVTLWTDTDRLVHGQVGGGNYILHTTADQNTPYAFVLNTAAGHLTSYSAQRGQGIQVLGARLIQHDSNVTDAKGPFSVAQARKKGGGGKGKKKKRRR